MRNRVCFHLSDYKFQQYRSISPLFFLHLRYFLQFEERISIKWLDVIADGGTDGILDARFPDGTYQFHIQSVRLNYAVVVVRLGEEVTYVRTIPPIHVG